MIKVYVLRLGARAGRPDGWCAGKHVNEAVLMVGNLFKWDRTIFPFALFFEAPRRAGRQVTGQLMILIYLNIFVIL